MKEGERSEMIAIGHPSLLEWSRARGMTIDEAIHALRVVSHVVYSDRPALIDRERKRNYLAIQGLINVLQQLTLVQERDIFALSQRCPVRMKQYGEALRSTLELAASMVKDEESLDAVKLTYLILIKELIVSYHGTS